MPDNDPTIRTTNDDVSDTDSNTGKLNVDSAESTAMELPTKATVMPEPANSDSESELKSTLECLTADHWPPGSRGAMLQTAYWAAVESGDRKERVKAAEDYEAFLRSQRTKPETTVEMETPEPSRDGPSHTWDVHTWSLS